MHIKIHRGTEEIGGTVIELSTEQSTLLLDLGLPLSPESGSIDVGVIKADAVLISHPHQDHFGLIDHLENTVPVYIGELGKQLIDATRIFLRKDLHSNNFHYYKNNAQLMIGDFKVTPYLMDHSAVDAYSFLIEVEGKRIFYSGDFRAHGRKSILFDRFLKNPPKDIDILMMEGTMMKRSNDDFPTEAAVEQTILETIRHQENITFLICSSQNIDRIVSAYRACLKSGKILVVDFYTAWVLEKMKLVSNSVPAMDWEHVRVYADCRPDEVMKENKEYFGDFRKRAYTHRILKEELGANPSKFLYLSKMSKFKVMDLYKDLNGRQVNVIYSQWLGYLNCSNDEYYGAETISDYRVDSGVNFIYAHTSGHATLTDLQRFSNALQPKLLIPIHTEYKTDYLHHFSNVMILDDKQFFDV